MAKGYNQLCQDLLLKEHEQNMEYLKKKMEWKKECHLLKLQQLEAQELASIQWPNYYSYGTDYSTSSNYMLYPHN